MGLWNLYYARVHRGEHVRIFPISNWTELDVWRYIEREEIALPSLYFAHRRAVIPRNGLLVAVTPVTLPRTGEAVEERSVRFRTVGDMTCTCPVIFLLPQCVPTLVHPLVRVLQLLLHSGRLPTGAK